MAFGWESPTRPPVPTEQAWVLSGYYLRPQQDDVTPLPREQLVLHLDNHGARFTRHATPSDSSASDDNSEDASESSSDSDVPSLVDVGSEFDEMSEGELEEWACY